MPVRDSIDAPKFNGYISLKGLSNVFGDEVQRVAAEVGDPNTAKESIEHDQGLVRFCILPRADGS